MKRFIVPILLVLFTAAARGQATRPVRTTQPVASATVDLWPEGRMPGQGAKEPEAEMPAKGDGFHRVTNVSRPTLTVFPAHEERPEGRHPRPGDDRLPRRRVQLPVIDKEGTEIAAWLNSAGVSAVVLKYRVAQQPRRALAGCPARPEPRPRARVREWDIDPKRLGIIGFSAGGNLAAKASTGFERRAYPGRRCDRPSKAAGRTSPCWFTRLTWTRTGTSRRT